jgi:hypothetical protein
MTEGDSCSLARRVRYLYLVWQNSIGFTSAIATLDTYCFITSTMIYGLAGADHVSPSP